jgi:hypothetical protein
MLSLTASAEDSGRLTTVITSSSGATTRRLVNIWDTQRQLASWNFASRDATPRAALLSART